MTPNELQASLAWYKEHAETLDKNWSTIYDAYGRHVCAALGVPPETPLYEVVEIIRRLRNEETNSCQHAQNPVEPQEPVE